jgi:nucleotide-binding universal stress UspA family protein
MVDTPRVVVPVAVLEGEVIPDALVEFLSAVPVVLLGYHQIPEQTLPEQARDEFGEQAAAELADLAAAFEARDSPVETRLAFTHDPARTVQQVVESVDRGVVLRPNPVQAVDRMLVVLRRAELLPAIAALVAALAGPTDATISLLVAADEEDAFEARLADGLATTLREAGIPEERIDRVTEPIGDSESVLLDASDEHDLVVLGEDLPGILPRIFGDTSERVAERTLAPVLVVQQPLET